METPSTSCSNPGHGQHREILGGKIVDTWGPFLIDHGNDELGEVFYAQERPVLFAAKHFNLATNMSIHRHDVHHQIEAHALRNAV